MIFKPVVCDKSQNYQQPSSCVPLSINFVKTSSFCLTNITPWVFHTDDSVINVSLFFRRTVYFVATCLIFFTVNLGTRNLKRSWKTFQNVMACIHY